MTPYAPAPGTCHPTYAQFATTIRANLPKGQDIIIKGTATTPQHHLRVYEHHGAAPYVGAPEQFVDPPFYMWRSAIDDLGRAVAGEARLVMRVRV